MSALIFHSYTIINNKVVTITAYHQVSDADCAICEFCIQNSCNYSVRDLAITKWLKKEWAFCAQHLKTQGLTPICKIHHSDGKGFYRWKAYRRLGFIPIYGLGLIWGYLPRQFCLEEYLKRNGYPPLPEEFFMDEADDIYVEWNNYYEPELYSSGIIYTLSKEGTCHYWHDTKQFIIKWE